MPAPAEGDVERRPRPPVNPAALRQAAGFPALQAIFSRRSRRFALGAELTGPLAHRSSHDPLPLGVEEEAILVAAGTGITGVARDEWPFRDAGGGPTGADKLASYTGRAYPSPLAQHGTELFWTNDEGTFVLPQRTESPVAYTQLADHSERTELYRRAVKLQGGRLEIPRATPNLFGLNHWIANAEGSTLFIPISDVTRQCISASAAVLRRPPPLLHPRPASERGSTAAAGPRRLVPGLPSGRPVGLRALADGGHATGSRRGWSFRTC